MYFLFLSRSIEIKVLKSSRIYYKFSFIIFFKTKINFILPPSSNKSKLSISIKMPKLIAFTYQILTPSLIPILT